MQELIDRLIEAAKQLIEDGHGKQIENLLFVLERKATEED